jgi:competence protein ComEA
MADFSKKERTGVVVLLGVGVLLLFIPQVFLYIYRLQMPGFSIKNLPFDTVAVNKYGYKKQSYTWQDWSDDEKPLETARNEKQTFSFNPNAIGYDSLLLLGFNPAAAKSIVNARAKGFVYRNVGDLQETFNVDKELIASLQDYIKFDKEPSNYSNQTFAPRQIANIEINSADSLAWEQLPRVGAMTITKIFKHKKSLGGFHHTEQLVDDKVIADSIFTIIKPYLNVDPSRIVKININTAQYRDLIKHPYFDSKTITVLQRYIAQHGRLKDPKDIRKIIALSKELGDKILPYISAE